MLAPDVTTSYGFSSCSVPDPCLVILQLKDDVFLQFELTYPTQNLHSTVQIAAK